ncbi:hypothetical protein ACTNDP_21255 [Paenibacillus barengoltzii]|uniref:hypothetical protein n=1 Tax=Paenibacillus barengoltzii TaxID=343517 RepID=UPI003F8CC3BE
MNQTQATGSKSITVKLLAGGLLGSMLLALTSGCGSPAGSQARETTITSSPVTTVQATEAATVTDQGKSETFLSFTDDVGHEVVPSSEDHRSFSTAAGFIVCRGWYCYRPRDFNRGSCAGGSKVD